MKSITMFLLFVISISFLYAQDNPVRQKVEDALAEMETDQLTLRFFDAVTGDPIESAAVQIEKIGNFETDFEGRVLFPIPEDGLHKVIFTHDKFITSKFEFEVAAQTIVFNRYSISPKLPVGSIRVVLDWGEHPKDLDAHFVKEGVYHISYRNMKISKDGVAKLDRDDINSYGPETITAKKIDKNAEYHFYVHDFTNKHNSDCTKMSNSNASLKVYGGDNELLGVFRISPNKSGIKWNVFRIIDGKIQVIDSVE